MSNSVYRVIEVVGTSTESWEDAASSAVETASGSLRDLRIAEVYLQVFGMLARPAALFAPRVLAAAARAKPHQISASAPPDRPPVSAQRRQAG